MSEDGYLLIGKVAGAHGIRGVVKIASYAESVSVFSPGVRILLKKGTAASRAYTVDWVKPFKRNGLLALKGVTDRDQAESLAGCDLFIDQAILPELEKDTYYWSDLIGMDVFTAEESCIGRITAIIPTGSNDVYVVKDGDKETLVPAIQSVVIDIDTDRKTMKVDLPEGL